jgi:hypothetical protein
MSAYVSAADKLRERFHCLVIIIHHCGVDATRPRGHTSLTGAVDAQIAVKRGAGNVIVATVEWMKDGPEGAVIASKLKVIEIGTDENGEIVTSCVVEDAEEPAASKSANGRLSPKDKIALDTLKRAVAAHGKPAPGHNHIPPSATVVDVDTWRRFYLAGTSADDQSDDTRRKAWRDARDRLMAHQIISVCDEMVWTS